MTDRRLLLLSYCFPPITAPEAMLSAKRLGNLPGWQVDVVAAAPFSSGLGNDPAMADYVKERFGTVRRLKPLLPWFPYHRLGLPARMPDQFRFLNRRAVRAARDLGLERYDAMLSWSQWHSVHLAAQTIKTLRPGLPWLAHFSDPWTDNAFVDAAPREAAINLRLERGVMARADRLLFTSEETVDLVMAKYPAEWRAKTEVIPHGYDPALYPGRVPPGGPVRVARYLGNFYGRRTPLPLLRVLAEALARDPGLPGRLRVEIVGGIETGMDLSEAPSLPEGLVSFRRPVNYVESLGLMEEADILLIVDAPGPLSVFLPSKLVDYIGAGRPIVALTPPGAAARVTRETGGWVAAPDQPEAGARALLAALDAAETPTAFAGRDRYSAAATGRALAEVLSGLVG